MEDVLDLYEEPYDPAYPTVCLDEKPVVLHTRARPPVPAHPCPPSRERWNAGIMNTSVRARPTSL